MSQSEHKSKYNRPMSDDEMQQLLKTGIMLLAGAFVFMGVVTLLVHFETVALYPSSMNVDMLRGFAGRAEYALRYQSLLVAWLVFNVFATIGGRYQFKAFNPLDETKEDKVQMHKNILTNSFEQITISVFAQLILVSFATPEAILKYIPLINMLQFIGRIAFFFGYPYKRSFGFSTTAMPNVVMVTYIIYKFITFQFNL